MSKPEFIVAPPGGLEPQILGRVVQSLASGQLLVLPTDTVYGLACRADDPEAVRRLFAAKIRPTEKALPLLIARLEHLSLVSPSSDPRVALLAEHFWPGPLTLVLPRAAHLPDILTGGLETVGIRLPDLALTRQVLDACCFPVAVTSANISAEPPACQVADLPEALLVSIDLVIDGGQARGGQPSTVLDLTVTPPLIRRAGPVTEGEITRLIGPVQTQT